MAENENINEEVQGEEEEGKAKGRTFVEELEVASSNLVREVERLIKEGNVRKLIIKRENEVLVQVNLTLGVAGAGALMIFAPIPAVILAAVAAVAAAVANVTILIEREAEVAGEAEADEDEEDL